MSCERISYERLSEELTTAIIALLDVFIEQSPNLTKEELVQGIVMARNQLLKGTDVN